MTTALICAHCFDENGVRVPTVTSCSFCGRPMCGACTAVKQPQGAMCAICEMLSSKPKERAPYVDPDALMTAWLTEDAPLSKVVKTMNRQKAAEKLIRKHSGKYALPKGKTA